MPRQRGVVPSGERRILSARAQDEGDLERRTMPVRVERTGDTVIGLKASRETDISDVKAMIIEHAATLQKITLAYCLLSQNARLMPP